MSGQQIKLYIFIVLAMLFWGFSFVWSAIVFEYLTPMATILSRLVLSSALLLVWLLIRGGLRFPKGAALRNIALLALLQPFAYFIGESFGLQHTTPIIAAIVIALIPVFTPVAAHLIGQEKMKIRNVIGILISFSGVVLIVSSGDFKAEADFIGLALLLLAVLAAVAYTLRVRRTAPKMSSIEVITWQNTIGLFFFLPLVLIFDIQAVPLKALDMRFTLALISLAVLASSLAFVFYFEALRKLGPSRANAFSNTIPAFTAFFAWLILGEILSAPKIIGMLIVIGGVILSQSGRKKSVLIPGG